MRFLVINHLVVEAFGLYDTLCREQSIALDVIQVETGDRFPSLQAGDYDALCVMGGPMNVDQEAQHPWLIEEKALIRHAVRELEMPYLGICLGAQLLADALGGTVGPMDQPEVGVYSIERTAAGRSHPLLADLSDPVPVLQWHGQEVKQLPPGATLLASSPGCTVQAFEVGDRAVGFQFHHEICDNTLNTWLSVPAYRAELIEQFGPDGCDSFRQAVEQHMAAMNRDSRLVFGRFVQRVAQLQSRENHAYG